MDEKTIIIILKCAYFVAAALLLFSFAKDFFRLRKRGAGEKKTWFQCLFSKENGAFLLFSFVMAFCANAYGALQSAHAAADKAEITFWEAVPTGIQNAAKMYAFEYEPASVFSTDRFYRVCYLICIAACAASVAAVVIRTAVIQWNNEIRIRRKIRKGCDIVVGGGSKALRYAENNRESILWIPAEAAGEDFAPENYSRLGICYYCAPFSAKEIARFLRLKRRILWKLFPRIFGKEYHFIVFQEENTANIIGVSETFSALKTYCKTWTNGKNHPGIRIYVHMEVGNEIEPFAKFDLINRDGQDQSAVKVLCDTFNVYTSIANEFCMNRPLVPDIPKEFFAEDRSLVPDCEINLVLFGYGKVNAAMFRKMVEQYQFCSYNEKFARYEAHPLNYYIFDKDADKLGKDAILSRLGDTDRFCAEEMPDYLTNARHKAFFEGEAVSAVPQWDNTVDYRMEKPCNLKTYGGEEGKYGSGKAQELLDKLLSHQKSLTLVFVGIEDDLNNYRHAQELRHKYFTYQNLRVFCNFDEASMGTLGDQPEKANGIELYGAKNCLSEREVLSNRRLAYMSRNKDSIYCSKKGISDNWYGKSNFERESSVAAGMHTGFKLSLLGFRLEIPGEKECVDNDAALREFQNEYCGGADISSADYADYFRKSVRAVICYSEHLRWCAYYFMNGFDPEPEELFSYAILWKSSKEDLTRTGVPDEALEAAYDRCKGGENLSWLIPLKKLSAESVETVRQICREADRGAEPEKSPWGFVIDKKLESFRYHGCLRNFYGVDAMHLYFAELAEYYTGIPKAEYLKKEETFKYDTEICDEINKVLRIKKEDEKNGEDEWLFKLSRISSEK